MQNMGQFISNHWMLWLALLAVLLLIFINEFLSQKKQAKEITPNSAIDLINNSDAVVIDLRDAETFRAGHITDAVRASENDFSQPRLEKFKSKPIILVCTKGLQSITLASKLRNAGYTQPLVLAGGINAWTAANLPLVKGK